ncbi:LamG-like jellyroll fold domain-containing protein [Streptomyces sp. NPDC002640]
MLKWEFHVRPGRSLVVLLASVMAVLGGAELPAGAESLRFAAAPEQRWGEADGLRHLVSGAATSAAAGGGRASALSGKGQVPAAGDAGRVKLDVSPDLPGPGPLKKADVPGATAPAGFDEKRSKEVPGERSKRSSTYLNADGTFTTRFFTEPVNYRDTKGNWRRIDTTLVPQEASGLQTMSAVGEGWETKETASPIEFATTADAESIVRMTLGDGLSIAYGVENAGPSVGEVAGSVVTYRGVIGDADLEFVAGSSSVKETIVLHEANAPTEWRYPLNLKGLTARVDEHGVVVFEDTDGQVRAWMPAGWMQDSNHAENANEGEISTGVTYEIEQKDGRQVLVVSLDREWLSSSDRVFPVRVDPSVKSIDATSGTYVQYPYNQNFASDTVLKVGTYDGGGHKAAAFMRFTGLEDNLKNAWVVDARLALYNTWSSSCTARPVTVHPITSSWSESTTSKYPGPATGSSLASKSFAHGWRPDGATSWTCGPAWESIKLGSAGRKLVDDWTHGRKKNYGLAVKASTTDSKGWKQFGSDDYPNGKPSLDVTWTKYGATYKLGDLVAPVTATTQGVQKVTVTNQGQETWPQGGAYKLRYNLFDASGKEITDSSKIAYTEMPEAISPGESVTLDAKIAPLPLADYTLQWTMTEYGVSRFTTAGVPGPAVKISAVNIPPQLTAEKPASGVTVDSLTPTLWAAASDADRYPKASLQYSFDVCEVEGADARKNCRTSPRGDDQAWAVPTGWLSWGKTYAWYAYAYDGAATSTRPGPAFFTTQVPQPAVTSHLGGAGGSTEVGVRAGNYVTAATDASVSTVGPRLAVDRTYNSLDPRVDGAFGTGWSTPWDMAVRDEPTTKTVLVTMTDGSQLRFGVNPDGEYAAPPASGLDLQRPTGQTTGWVLRTSEGTTYTFLAGGDLARVTDSAGRTQEITRTSADGGDLKKVTDTLSGRSLTFGWTDGHITSVTTSPISSTKPGPTWAYTYEGNRLKTVCPPDSTTRCTSYSYENGSVYRSNVLDAAPSFYWRLGENEGSEATSEAPSVEGLNSGVYRDVHLGVDGALAGTTDSAASFDGTQSAVELPSATLRGAAFPTVELWFKTSTPSGVLVGFQNEEVGGAPTSYRPVLNIDVNGKLRGEFRRVGEVGATGPITSPQAVTDNTWHHVVLTAHASGQTLYLDGAKVGSISGPVSDQSRDFAYLGAGHANTSWLGLPSGEYRFTGQIDDVAMYGHSLDAATIADHYAARAVTGRVNKVILPSGRTHSTVSYDPVDGRVTEYTDNNGGTSKISAPSYSNASSSYAQTIQASRPTGYWRLDERSGAVAASPIGEDVNGTYQGGVSLGHPGAFADGDDTAVHFDGDSAVEVPTEAMGTGTASTVELWFKTRSPGVLVTHQNAELGETPTGWRPVLLIDADGKLRGKLTSSATSILSKAAVTDGSWHHVMLTGNEGAQALFVDGVHQGSAATGVENVRHPYVYIGAGYASSGWDGVAGGYRNFTGEIDEVAFYDKPLVNFVKSGTTWSYKANATTDTPALRMQARRVLTAGSADQYRGVAVSDAPTGYWRLGESEGTTLRSVTGDTDKAATFTPDSGGKSALGAAGIFGTGENRAVSLSNGGVLRLPSTALAGTTHLSIEMWFRTTSKNQVLFAFQNTPVGEKPTTWRAALNIDKDGKLAGQFLLDGISSATPIRSAAVVNDNVWHHAVLSGAGDTQSLYLDGVKVGTLDGGIGEQSRPYTYVGGGWGTSGWLGEGTTANTYYFTGDIDEVAVYRNALDADAVAAHYRAHAESASSGLTSTYKVTDALGYTTTRHYDVLHGQRPTAVTDEVGATTTYAYDINGNLHTATDPNGHTTVTGHDARGNAVSTTTCRDADSCWTSFSTYYLNADDPLDPRNDKPLTYRDQRSSDRSDSRYLTQYTYNSRGLLQDTIAADGSTTKTAYTTGTEAAVGGGTVPAGLVATVTSPEGSVTTYRYHVNGDLAESTAPSGMTTRYTYDGLGRVLTETERSDSTSEDVTTIYAYDSASRVVSETGTGVRNEITNVIHTAAITRTYDEDGNLLTEATEDTTGTDPKRTTTYHYDQFGLNDTITDAESRTTVMAHDRLGRVTTMTDPAGNRFEHQYTPRGQHAETILKHWTGHPSGEVQDLVLESHAYDPAGRLASTTDSMGATTNFTYFDDGLPAATTALQVTQQDGSRRDIVLEENRYDAAGNLIRQTTGGGRTVETYTVNALGRTTHSILDPDGLNRGESFTYDRDGRIKTHTAAISQDKNLTTNYDYDPAGNPVEEEVTDGTTTHITTYAYDDRGLLRSQTSPRGNTTGADPAAHTTSYRYDALGRLVEEKLPPLSAEENGEEPRTVRPTTLIGYNTFGEPTEEKDARGQVTRAQFDRVGNTVAVTLPPYTPPNGTALTPVVRTDYDSLDRPQTVTDPLGRIIRYGYDQLGNLVTRTDPVADAAQAAAAFSTQLPGLADPDLPESAGGVTRYTWTPTGLQLSVTDPTGARSEATYDELGRQLTATTVERFPTLQNLTSRYRWDDASNQTSSSTPSGVTTTAVYNAAGEIREVTDAAGTVRMGFDRLGRQTETVDATGRKTVNVYDALGNVTETIDYGNSTTALRTVQDEFDVEGNRTASISPETGARTTFAYNAMGRMIRQVEPVNATKSITSTFGYDAAGNLTRMTDGRGNSTVYTFNSLGLPESTIEPSTAQHPDRADRTWTTVYDVAAQPVLQLLPGGVKRQSTYDGLGRLIQETGTGAEAATTDRTLSYDLAGRLTSAGGDGLNPNTYTYNDRGLLLTTAGPGGNTRYTYDADGRMTSRIDDHNTTEYAYDAAGRLDSLWNQMTGTSIWYDFDAAGRPRLEQYVTPGTETVSMRRSYDYDSLGRLTTDMITKPDGSGTLTSVTYDYDLEDNLTRKETTGTIGAGINTYAYDHADRMTSWTEGTSTTAYEWDDAGNRTTAGDATATYDARNRLLTDGANSYTYSPRGTLATVSHGTDLRKLYFDAFERKITDGDSAYTYDSLDRVATHNETSFAYDGGSNNLLHDGTSSYARLPDGTLLSTAIGDDMQWSLLDRHTDLVAGLSADGTVVKSSTAYSPFGEESATSGTTPAVGYQSGWTDPETGDVNMAARWYQPDTGAFASRDTWQLAATPSAQANRYSYAMGDPLGGIDPSGHKSMHLGGGRPCLCSSSLSSRSSSKSRGNSSTRPAPSKERAIQVKRATGNSQGGRVQRDLHRLDSRVTRPTTRSAYNGGTGRLGNSYRGGNSQSRGSSGKHAPNQGGTTRTTTPKPPQNPNSGSNPRPAPTRPAPKPRVDVARIQQASLNGAVKVSPARLTVAQYQVSVATATTKVKQRRDPDTDENEDEADCTAHLNQSNEERGTEGIVCFRAPVGATSDQIEELKDHIAALNASQHYLSPTGRVSTGPKSQSMGKQQSGSAGITLGFVAERYKEQHMREVRNTQFTYAGSGKVAGHLPDTTWSGKWSPYCWHQQDGRVNSLVGSYSQKYVVGYKPTGFYYAGVHKDPSTYATEKVTGSVSRGEYGLCSIIRFG